MKPMQFVNRVKQIGVVLLAMSGILVDRINYSRIILLLLSTFSIILFFWINAVASFQIILLYFIVVFGLRYLFLFTSFLPNGIADRLTARFGERKAFEIYRFATALLFIHRGLSFGCLIEHTGITPVLPPGYHYFIVGAGIILMLLGMFVNIWSTLIIGIDAYYYKDLFVGRFLSEFKQVGPYKYLANPMYGIGQANAYGSALLSGSISGIVATLINQLSMYLFYILIEKKHIQKMLAAEAR